MDIRDYMIMVTQSAADEAFRYARATPADKLDWSPLDLGRSVIDQCREMAICPDWCQTTISNEPQPEFTEDVLDPAEADMESWQTVDDCQRVCNEKLQDLFTVFRGLTEAQLSSKKWLPYDGGRDFTMVEMMGYPRWNFTYHLGQIAYIQTLLGDKEDH